LPLTEKSLESAKFKFVSLKKGSIVLHLLVKYVTVWQKVELLEVQLELLYKQTLTVEVLLG